MDVRSLKFYSKSIFFLEKLYNSSHQYTELELYKHSPWTKKSWHNFIQIRCNSKKCNLNCKNIRGRMNYVVHAFLYKLEIYIEQKRFRLNLLNMKFTWEMEIVFSFLFSFLIIWILRKTWIFLQIKSHHGCLMLLLTFLLSC